MVIFPGYNEQNPVITNKKRAKNKHLFFKNQKSSKKVEIIFFSLQKEA